MSIKNYIATLGILWATTTLVAQTATFYADTSRLWIAEGQHLDYYNKVKTEMVWKIRGQTLHFGDAPIHITLNLNSLDTVFYQQNSRAKWDTILCLISKPNNYQFIYNTCCASFYITYRKENFDRNDIFISPQVCFQINKKKGKKTYLGALRETGLILSSAIDTLRPDCGSPMMPNVYPLLLSEITIGTESDSCDGSICMNTKQMANFGEYIMYQTISNKLDFLWMPLSNTPFYVIYDPQKGTITYK